MPEDETIRKYALQNALLHGGKAEKGAVLGKLIGEKPDLKPKIRQLMQDIERIIKDVNSLSPESQRAELEKSAPELLVREKKERTTELPDLPGAETGNIVMRLAPYPSGPLHIGNARMVLLNDEYVKMYCGKLILVFDDTIGSEEKNIVPEAYGMIKDALDWLGVTCHEILYKSDRLPLFYEWAEKLIMNGNAYVCECATEVLRKNRADGAECAHRQQGMDENLEKWKRMLSGGYAEGSAILRLKTDMRHKNPAFRDRALLRIKEKEHPRAGTKYRVWPLLEFSWAVDDHLLGVTHVLRGKDLVIEDEMEKYIWHALGLKPAQFVHYGMLRIKESKLSKSKSMAEVKSGAFSGWDDPRTWSIQSLRKRGIRPEAVRKFILSFGVSLSDIEVPAENLYSENRALIDAGANRYFFVSDPVWIRIDKLPRELQFIEAVNHPDFEERGRRKVAAGDEVAVDRRDFEKLEGQEIRLKDFCNIRLGKESEFLSREVRDIPKIQWAERKSGIPVAVVMDDGSAIEGVGEASISGLKEGDVVQFERFGFVRIDSKGGKITACFGHK